MFPAAVPMKNFPLNGTLQRHFPNFRDGYLTIVISRKSTLKRFLTITDYESHQSKEKLSEIFPGCIVFNSQNRSGALLSFGIAEKASNSDACKEKSHVRTAYAKLSKRSFCVASTGVFLSPSSTADFRNWRCSTSKSNNVTLKVSAVDGNGKCLITLFHMYSTLHHICIAYFTCIVGRCLLKTETALKVFLLLLLFFQDKKMR